MRILNAENTMNFQYMLVLIFCAQISIGLTNHTFRKHKVIPFAYYTNYLNINFTSSSKSYYLIHFIRFFRSITLCYILINIRGALARPSNKSYLTWTAIL